MFIINVLIVLRRHYPGFNDLLNSLPDHRQRSSYQVAEIIMAGLSMFIFKRGSRNNADCGAGGGYEKNYIALFGLRLPVMDTVDVFLRGLPAEELERLKQVLVHKLIEKKVLEKWKYDGRYIVAVDGTGVFSFDHEPFAGCPYKESKNGVKTWQATVVEAKLLGLNGLSISMATQWLDNSENMDQKQDCEQKAFVRLASKIKQAYPRLPIIIAADALYPNQTVFTVCKDNGWRFIFTFKEGTLTSVWEEIYSLYPLLSGANKQEKVTGKTATGWLYETMMYINDLQYKKYTVNWLEYQQGYKGTKPDSRFVHLTDMPLTKNNVWKISKYGRLRWCIENEGFNEQKNNGYALQHKYSRKHLVAMKNYYQLLQIAHLINQLTEKLKNVKSLFKESKITWKALWEDIMACMKKEQFCVNQIEQAIQLQKQLRY